MRSTHGRSALAARMFALTALVAAAPSAGCARRTILEVTVTSALVLDDLTTLGVTITHGGESRDLTYGPRSGEALVSLPTSFTVGVNGLVDGMDVIIDVVAYAGASVRASGTGTFDMILIGRVNRLTIDLGVASPCGNGAIDGGEECDGLDLAGEDCTSRGLDGGTLACDPTTCTFDLTACMGCGNGAIEGTEVCDTDDFGPIDCTDLGFSGGVLTCTPTCTLDLAGCATCGNSTAEVGEDCDGSDLAGATCGSVPGFDEGTLGCATDCTFDTSACIGCGDGAAEGTEVCDGADLLGATCTSIGQGFVGGTLACATDCTYDTATCTAPAGCGDGTIIAPEDCDSPAMLGGATCMTQGFPGGTLSCTGGCVFDTSGCWECGNGTLDPGEVCDVPDLGSGTCITLGHDAGSLACTSACAYDESGCSDCGDGTIGAAEACDGSNLGGATCVSAGPFTGGTLACTAACAFDISGCTVCGDSVRAGAELCDGADLGGEDCVSIMQGFVGGTLACATDGSCTYDTSGCTLPPNCPDGDIDAGEDCDGANLGGATCASIGMGAGTLACGPGCLFDAAGCYTCGDMMITAIEVCDAMNLGGQTCTTLGHDAGTLACAAGCLAFDEVACSDCGDGTLETPETCDGSSFGASTCVSLGYTGGSLACYPSGTPLECTIDTAACYTCGNGAIQPPEVCDGASLGGQTCLTLGHDGGALSCAAGCLAFNETACSDCGDATIESPETCDGANLGGSTCVSLGYTGGSLACTPAGAAGQCLFDTGGCYTCGDALVTAVEVCDGANLDGENCMSRGYLGGMLSCNPSCLTFDESMCTNCGNGIINPPEQCDMAALGGQTCTTYMAGTFSGGTLSCSGTCTFVTSGCYPPPTVPSLLRPLQDTNVGTNSVSLSRRPNWTWTASNIPGCTGPGCPTISYDIQYSTTPGFLAGTTTLLTGSSGTSFQPISDLPSAVFAPVGTRYWWRVRACAGGACSAYSEIWRFTVGRPDRDFNGDNFDDVVIGSALFDAGIAAPIVDAGRLAVYFGGSTPNTVIDGNIVNDTLAGDRHGWSVATCDLNGDGFSDLIGGAPQFDTPALNAGQVRIYLGATGTSFNTTVDFTINGLAGNDNFGHSVACGDLNGDGFADLIVGAPDTSATALGYFHVYLGASPFNTTLDASMAGETGGDRMGHSVAFAGDVNDDGFGDFLVGAIQFGATDTGKAYLYYGASTLPASLTASATYLGVAGSDQYGFVVAGAGDLNGDGCHDYAVSSPYVDAGGTDRGRVYVYFGWHATDCALTAVDATADLISGSTDVDELGHSVASAKDMDGDAFHDLVVGVPKIEVFAGGDVGFVYIYRGGAGSTFDTSGDLTLSATGASSNDWFGTDVWAVGNFNGDGFDDVAGAANFKDSAAGTLNVGGVYVFYGAAPLIAGSDWSIEGTSANEELGTSVASMGSGDRTAGGGAWPVLPSAAATALHLRPARRPRRAAGVR